MEKYFDMLYSAALFAGIEKNKLPSMLSCLDARVRGFGKNELVFMEGQPANEVGLVLMGEAHVTREDVFGNRTILTHLGRGDLFGEAYACAKMKRLPVTVCAVTESEIMFIDCKRILTTCTSACVFHTRLIENLMSVLAGKNILLMRKIEHISRRTTRDKLYSYLAEQARVSGSRDFKVPFNRQEMADYLCVERSAMSSELGRMRDEGMIEFEKNRFRLLEAAPAYMDTEMDEEDEA